MTKVLIGIPTYNGYHRIDWLLKSISMRTGKTVDYKIVICDDSGNTDHQKKTELMVNKWKHSLPVELLINDKNVGVASSWNRLVKCQDSTHIILINDDVIVAKDWLENMVYFLDNNPNIGAVCYDCLKTSEIYISQLLSSPPNNIYNKSFVPERVLPIGRSKCGCFFGFRRDKYDTVGGFDENYYAFREEVDFYTTLLSHRYPIYKLYCPRNWHMISSTFRTAPEINVPIITGKSIEYYYRKWSNHPDIVQNSYLEKIPFQKIKWICDGKIYE